MFFTYLILKNQTVKMWKIQFKNLFKLLKLQVCESCVWTADLQKWFPVAVTWSGLGSGGAADRVDGVDMGRVEASDLQAARAAFSSWQEIQHRLLTDG